MIRSGSIIFFAASLFFLVTPDILLAGSTPADSLRVKWMNGKKFILHKVEPRETWTGLSKRYNCTINELMEANKGIEVLKIDQIVNIPINEEATGIKASPPVEKVSNSGSTEKNPEKPQPAGISIRTPVVHTVKPGETLFSIARKYDQPVEQIKDINHLKADGIQIGQKLIVKYVVNEGNQVVAQSKTQAVVVPPSQPKQENAVAMLPQKNSEEKASDAIVALNQDTEPTRELPRVNEASPNEFFDKPTKTVTPVKKSGSGKSMMQISETGVATLFLDGNQSQTRYYGLHRSAPIGTIMKVTNRMNNQFVYVKIVGVLPDTGENDNVIIKMSQAVAEKLNALDKFFQVELSYGLME